MKIRFSWQPVLAFLAIVMALASCTKSKADTGTDQGAGEPNTVTGIVVDGKGNPLAGVRVRAENSNGNNIHVTGTTGADGRYKLKLTAVGGWTIFAWKEVQYEDKTYYLRLAMKNDTDYDAFATNDKSITRDFIWKLSGRIPDRGASIENGFGYFGASIRLVNHNEIVPAMRAGTKLTVTLTPVAGAKYLDGTAATVPVVKTFNLQDNNVNYYIGDVPVTTYRITAKSEYNGVTKKVFIGASSASNLVEWIEFYFDPSGASSGSKESGLQSPNDFPYYLGQGQ